MPAHQCLLPGLVPNTVHADARAAHALGGSGRLADSKVLPGQLMPVNAMRLNGSAHPPLSQRVDLIFCVGAGEQMRRIDALGIVAAMANKEAIRDMPKGPSEGYPVRQQGASGDPEPSVAVSVESGQPLMASGFCADLDLRAESRQILLGRRWNLGKLVKHLCAPQRRGVLGGASGYNPARFCHSSERRAA